MKYKTICSICGRQSPISNDIVEHYYKKYACGFIEMNMCWSNAWGDRNFLSFCPLCAKKSYTIEELTRLRISNNEWSY
jgi:hypothetical protein